MLRKIYIKIMFWSLRKLVKDKNVNLSECDIVHLKCKMKEVL